MSAAASSMCRSWMRMLRALPSPRCRARRRLERRKKGADPTPAPPFSIDRLDHVVLPVSDMAAAKAFYCGILGCTEEREIQSAGMVQLRAGASLIDLVDIAIDAGAWARPPVEG